MHTDTKTGLGELDRDGAIRESLERTEGDTRADVLRRAVVAGAGLVGGAAVLAGLPSLARAQSLSATDVAILNFALTLEELEAAFYADALAHGALKGEAKQLATTAGAHERAHVAAIRQVLGSSAIAKPTFDFKGTTAAQRSFLATAVVLEDTGVAAYKGQAPLIEATAVLEAGLAIHSVEARHAAWARTLVPRTTPIPLTLDRPLTKDQVLAAVGRTGFITG
jgi:rubrerythrin